MARGRADGLVLLGLMTGAALAAALRQLAAERGITVSQLLREAVASAFADELPTEALAEAERMGKHTATLRPRKQTKTPADTPAPAA